MTARRVVEGVVSADELAALLAPRHGVVSEEEAPPGGGPAVFGLASGPYRTYERTVEVLEARPDGSARIRQTVALEPAIPYFAVLFRRASLRRASRLVDPGANPWWAPPDQLDARSATMLGCLGALAIVCGYLNTLFTQTVAFAADEFHASTSAEGFAGSFVRVGGVLALVLVARSDRLGRRRLLLLCAGAGSLIASTGALAPSLPVLTGTQVVSRAFASALLVLIAVAAVEEMPAGSRAYAVSVLAMAGGLGAGMCVLSLNLADVGPRGWRLIYAIPLLAVPFSRNIARHLPETRRFERHAEDSHRSALLTADDPATARRHRRRLVLIAASGFLSNLFVAPASQFNNRFLTSERGFSGGKISLLSLGTGTPAGIGVIVGGRMADVRGRRLLGGSALLIGTVLNVVFYFSSGWGLWAWALVSSTVMNASIPALGVYGPELFPTSQRGRANGVIAVAALSGSAVGLALAGRIADHYDRVGPALALLAVGPVIHALLVLTVYPETAKVELEEINPEDRDQPRDENQDRTASTT